MSRPDESEKEKGGEASWVSQVMSTLVCVGIVLAVAYPMGLWWQAALAMGMQVVAWVPSALAQTEKFYDFTGMLTFIAVSFLSQLASLMSAASLEDGTNATNTGPRQWPWRHLLATSLMLVWTIRLGTFLFARIRRDGHDSRFTRVRDRPLKFLFFWVMQGMWVFMTSLPLLTLHNTLTLRPNLRQGEGGGWTGHLAPFDMTGIALWSIGMAIEVKADREKAAFQRNPTNSGRFIDSGLWSLCRHPNYLGEMVIWLGMFCLCARGVIGAVNYGWIAVLGPLFVVILLVGISTPLLEAGSDKKFGGQSEYQEYKRRTPVFLPRLW